MKKHDRHAEHRTFSAALDELLDQWWDQELLTDVAYWLKREVDNQNHDPSCECHDYYRERLHAAVKALRAWRNRTQHTQPQLTGDEESELLEQLDAQLTDEEREFRDRALARVRAALNKNTN